MTDQILEEHDNIKVIIIDSMIDLLLPVTGYDSEGIYMYSCNPMLYITLIYSCSLKVT